jgi:hypothetical protein
VLRVLLYYLKKVKRIFKVYWSSYYYKHANLQSIIKNKLNNMNTQITPEKCTTVGLLFDLVMSDADNIEQIKMPLDDEPHVIADDNDSEDEVATIIMDSSDDDDDIDSEDEVATIIMDSSDDDDDSDSEDEVAADDDDDSDNETQPQITPKKCTAVGLLFDFLMFEQINDTHVEPHVIADDNDSEDDDEYQDTEQDLEIAAMLYAEELERARKT